MSELTDRLSADQAMALAGLLDVDPSAVGGGLSSLPPLWHGVYFLARPAQSELGPDGHPLNRAPAPPAPGLRRMFAGGRVTSYGALELETPAEMTSTVSEPVAKQSRSGPLWFVTQRLDYRQGGKLRLTEQKDIVYREQHSGGSVVGSRTRRELADLVEPVGESGFELAVDETLLFRFSALTYNAHRIHYDLAWAEYEGYAGLVVHGPLQGILMGEAFRRSGVDLIGRTFSYRLLAPCVGTQVLRIRSGADEAAVYDAAGVKTATATLEPVSTPPG